MSTTLAEDYLIGYGGFVVAFRQALRDGHRLGQAFFNALSNTDQDLLRATFHDPFYSSDVEVLHKTINFLINSKD